MEVSGWWYHIYIYIFIYIFLTYIKRFIESGEASSQVVSVQLSPRWKHVLCSSHSAFWDSFEQIQGLKGNCQVKASDTHCCTSFSSFGPHTLSFTQLCFFPVRQRIVNAVIRTFVRLCVCVCVCVCSRFFLAIWGLPLPAWTKNIVLGNLPFKNDL